MLLADTFQSKWILPVSFSNEYSRIPDMDSPLDTFIPLRTREGAQFLDQLDLASATGSDNIGTMVLKTLAGVLSIPFTKLARTIVRSGV